MIHYVFIHVNNLGFILLTVHCKLSIIYYY